VAYPNQNSQQAGTTASGLAYTRYTAYPYGVQDTLAFYVPAGHVDLNPGALAIVAHGFGGNAGFLDTPNLVGTRDALLEHGFIVCDAFAHDKAWGNDDALNDYARAYQYLAQYVLTPTDVLLHGTSMGGLTVALLYATTRIPNVRMVCTVDAAFNLAYAYAKGTYQPSIKTAYGIAADGSDYSLRTAGHDALLRPAFNYDAANWLFFASHDDSSIAQASNTDVFLANFAGNLATYQLVQCIGEHVDPSHFQPVPVLAFWDATVAGAPPPLPDAGPVSRDTQVQVYFADLGAYFPVDLQVYDATLGAFTAAGG
jgi:hypothetical protein